MTKHYNKKTEKQKRRSLRKEMTFSEKTIWTHLRKKQLGYRFLRQYSVDHFVIDFYCPKLKLAVEIDGSVHDEPEQKEKDKYRQKYLEQYKINFVRISNEEFWGNSEKAFKKIGDAIKAIEERKNYKTPP